MNPNTNTHTAEGFQNKAQEDFISYVYTAQLLQLRLKGIDTIKGVHISQQEVEKRFFQYPTFDRKKQINHLVKIGYLKYWQEKTNAGRKMDVYLALRACGFRPDLIQYKKQELGKVQNFMLNCLLSCTLPADSLSTPYFNFFLKYGEKYPFMFFRFDEFSGRLHTPVTSLPGAIRKNILINDQETESIDVRQMQPQLLGKILKEKIGNNQFSDWMDAGLDIYEILAANANLTNRNAGKDKFFELAFGYPNRELERVFGIKNWVAWINKYKNFDEPLKPLKYRNINHNNLAWLLQKLEVGLMKEVWKRLYDRNIMFLTVHDEVIVRIKDLETTEKIFDSVLSGFFSNYQLHRGK